MVKTRKHWNKQKSEKFLNNIHRISKDLASKASKASKASTASRKKEKASKAKVKADLPSLQKCWEHKDSEIHQKIQEIYSWCEVFESNETLTTSCNTYVRTVLSDSKLLKSAGFVPILSCLDISKRISIKLGIKKGKMIHVEEEIHKEFKRRKKDDKFESTLQKVAVTFVEKLNIFPIITREDYPGEHPHFAGVYLIYYVGQTSLYGKLAGSSQVPIYVGKSNNDILDRLFDHRRKIVGAKDLEVTDFVVRFMTLDIENYASSIEEMLIDHYDPLWNNKTVKFSFGNAKDPDNNWYAYHVAKVKCRRREMMKRVRVYKKHQ